MPWYLLVNDNRHLVALIFEADRDNPLFRAPIGDDPKQILDLGTGKGTWAVLHKQTQLTVLPVMLLTCSREASFGLNSEVLKT
ncbi:unnamed protein product [Penicillium palitans]